MNRLYTTRPTLFHTSTIIISKHAPNIINPRSITTPSDHQASQQRFLQGFVTSSRTNASFYDDGEDGKLILYLGTGQSYVPGGGHRTGPPGKHVVRGKGKYRLVDEKVRYYVGPGQEALESASAKGVGLSFLDSRSEWGA
jgi:hypothetical protein